MDKAFLDGLGLEEAQAEAVLQAHEEAVDRLKQEGNAALEQLRFENLLERTVTAAGGRSLKAVTALLEPEELTEGADLEAAVERVKAEHPYLFGITAAPAFAAGTGGHSRLTQPETLASALRERFGNRN